MKTYNVITTKYGWSEVQANSEEEAINLAKFLGEDNIYWDGDIEYSEADEV